MSRESQGAKIREIASLLGTRAEWLDALINFETAGTYDPMIKNPLSSARGLIQVLDSTAQSVFGVPTSRALVEMYPTFDSQMDNVVYPYLKRYAPFSSKQSLYMAVFYPAYRHKPPDTEFPDSVQAVNPGIVTIQDYIDSADRRVRMGALRIPKIILPLSAVVIVGVIVWMHHRRMMPYQN